MTPAHIPVEQLKNIGPTIAKRLHAVGVHVREDLLALGPVATYQRIRAKYSGQTVPVCYYLYSLEGALIDKHWNALGNEVKLRLKKQVSPSR